MQEAARLFEEAFSPMKDIKAGFIQISFEVGRVEIPPLLTYLERQTVRTQVCSACSGRTAVYGIALYCAYCGKRESLAAFLASLEATRACLAAVEGLPVAGRLALQATGGEDRLAENALGDTVSAFESYCRHRYSELVGTAKLTEFLKANGKNAFQRLDTAVAALEQALGRSLTSALKPKEWSELRLAFATRHVLTHNLGIADAQHIAAGGTTPIGQRVQVTRTIAERALGLAERLIQAMT
jgi:hypothetical protein